jgi:hypothetical protein
MLIPAVLTAAEEGERVSFNGKICLVPDGGELIFREADIHLFDTMTARTG